MRLRRSSLTMQHFKNVIYIYIFCLTLWVFGSHFCWQLSWLSYRLKSLNIKFASLFSLSFFLFFSFLFRTDDLVTTVFLRPRKIWFKIINLIQTHESFIMFTQHACTSQKFFTWLIELVGGGHRVRSICLFLCFKSVFKKI
jgi:hypothetical protein